MDILSYRFLGQVFTSAMTGNVALLGLGVGQGNVGAAVRNMTAFACFVAGLVVGAAVMRNGASRGRPIAAALIEAGLLGLFAVFWHLRGVEAALYGLIGLSAVAMGVQSAIAHRIGMPGISTTYFTGTMTGIVFGLVGRAQRAGEGAVAADGLADGGVRCVCERRGFGGVVYGGAVGAGSVAVVAEFSVSRGAVPRGVDRGRAAGLRGLQVHSPGMRPPPSPLPSRASGRGRGRLIGSGGLVGRRVR